VSCSKPSLASPCPPECDETGHRPCKSTTQKWSHAWLRLSGSGPQEVQNPGGWLTTVVARVCLNRLRSRADLVDRSPAAARQLASRARRRVRGAPAPDAHSDPAAQRRVVQAFFAAARSGDLGALVAVLDPDAVLRADGGEARREVSAVLRGAGEVARRATMFSQPGAEVHSVLVNGAAGAVVTSAGQPISVMGFTVSGGRIIEIDILLDPVRLRRLELAEFLLPQAEVGPAVQ
jgi:ketosteroid isomerase-like protein